MHLRLINAHSVTPEHSVGKYGRVLLHNAYGALLAHCLPWTAHRSGEAALARVVMGSAPPPSWGTVEWGTSLACGQRAIDDTNLGRLCGSLSLTMHTC